MKTALALLPLLLAAACGTVADEPTVSTAASSGPVIARIQPNGAVVVNTDVLQPTFFEGGQIAGFEVRLFADGPFLVRRGHTPGGKTRTDTIPLARVGARYYLAEGNLGVMLCIGGCTFCGIDFNHESCECPDGSDCETDFLEYLPIRILQI